MAFIVILYCRKFNYFMWKSPFLFAVRRGIFNKRRKLPIPAESPAGAAGFLVALIKTIRISRKIWGIYRDIFFETLDFPQKFGIMTLYVS